MTRTLTVAVAAVAVASAGLWWLHPILDRHEGTAAWVQAAGAILIIGATAWIASLNARDVQKHERIAKQQLWESIAVLARNCLDAIDTLLTACPPHVTSDPRGNFLRSYSPSDFEIPTDGLAAMPLHQIGDARLITAILNLRSVMGRMKMNLDEVQRNSLLSTTLEPIRNQRGLAFNAVASILRIVEGTNAETEISRLAARL